MSQHDDEVQPTTEDPGEGDDEPVDPEEGEEEYENEMESLSRMRISFSLIIMLRTMVIACSTRSVGRLFIVVNKSYHALDNCSPRCCFVVIYGCRLIIGDSLFFFVILSHGG